MLYPEVAFVPEDEVPAVELPAVELRAVEAPEQAPSRCQVRRRTARMLAVGVGLVVLVVSSAVGGAYAAVEFSDVPVNHPFASAIGWATSKGVANGYPDNTFRPGNEVNRGQMTQFLKNYNAEIEVVSGTASVTDSSQISFTKGCPLGKVAIAGGGRVNNYPFDVYLAESRPSGTSYWSMRWETEEGQLLDLSATVWVTCKPNDNAS